MRSADDPRAKATRSPRLHPAASRAPAARRWRSSASAACSSSTVGASPGTGTGAGYAHARTIVSLVGTTVIQRRGGAGPGAAGTGETGRGADRCRYLDGLGHRRLSRAAGRVDQEPRGREDGDAAGLRVGSRAAGAFVAEPPDLAHVVGLAQCGAPRAGRPGAQRPARPAGHAEHRRAAPEGGQRPGPHGRDPRHVIGGDVPQLRGPSAGGAGARPGPGRRGRPGLYGDGRRRRRRRRRGRVRRDPQVGHHQLRPEPGGRGPVPGRGGGGQLRPAAGRGLDPRRLPGRRPGAGGRAARGRGDHRERRSRPTWTAWPTWSCGTPSASACRRWWRG